MRRVYVAGRHAARVQEVQRDFVAGGWAVSFDWTSAPFVESFPLGHQSRREVAFDCLTGALTADVVVVLLPPDRPRECAGVWVEVGAALALGRPVLVSFAGEHPGSIFVDLAARVVTNDRELVAAATALEGVTPASRTTATEAHSVDTMDTRSDAAEPGFPRESEK